MQPARPDGVMAGIGGVREDSARAQREGGARGGLTPPPYVRGAGAGEGTGRRDRGLGNDEEDLPVAGGLSREIPGMRPAELGRWLGRIGGKNGGSSHLSWGLRRRLFPEIPGGGRVHGTAMSRMNSPACAIVQTRIGNSPSL